MKDIIDKLNKSVKDHESYRELHDKALEWIKDMKIQAQSYTDSHGKKEDVLEKSERLSKLKEKLPLGKYDFSYQISILT